MPLSLPASTISEIADLLGSGMQVYYHIETGELVDIPDEMNHPYFEPEMWKDELRKVKKDRKKFIVFRVMDSRQSFKMMQAFVENVADERVREKLENVLQSKKPFQHYNMLLRSYPDLRQEWFAYKSEQLAYWVHTQLQLFG